MRPRRVGVPQVGPSGEAWYPRLTIGVAGVGDEETYARMIAAVNKDLLAHYDSKFEPPHGGRRLILF
jgi:hypothetical protein